jgi:glycosyltransferase involved in cell wall biosynthesis
MEKTPLFSVLIANYNNGKYIEDALQSIFKQTYENWEIIIVDDASTDDSQKVYEKHKNNPKVKLYFNDQNMGCGYTKKRCIDLAIGEICGFLDPDDILDKEALLLMVEEHSNKPSCSLIYSTLYLCDEQLNINKRSTYQVQVPENSSFLEMKAGQVSQFATFKRSLYCQTEGINPKFKRAVDQDLYYKLEEVGRLFYLDKPLYYYRVNQGGISSFKNANKAFAWSLLARINACDRRGIDIEKILPNVIESEKSVRAFYETSSDYKLGRFLLKPVRFIKTLLSFYN